MSLLVPFFHVSAALLQPGTVILPGNWGRVIGKLDGSMGGRYLRWRSKTSDYEIFRTLFQCREVLAVSPLKIIAILP